MNRKSLMIGNNPEARMKAKLERLIGLSIGHGPTSDMARQAAASLTLAMLRDNNSNTSPTN